MNVGFLPSNYQRIVIRVNDRLDSKRRFSELAKQKVHNWKELPVDNLSLMTLLDADVKMLSSNGKTCITKNIFLNGDIVSLEKESIEGIEFEKLYFFVCGVIKKYNGVALNSLILREISFNEDGTIIDNVNISGRKKFSIPPSMCKLLGIKYSPGYELWPIDSGFKKVDTLKKEDIVYCDLSTYPKSLIDGTIRRIIVEMHGFSTFNSTHIITPNGTLVPTNDFINSLTVFVKENISTDNGCNGYKIGDTLPFKIVSRKNGNGASQICDEKHNIYLEIDLTSKSNNVKTSDGLIGISHTSLVKKDIDDIIGIKWDEPTNVNDFEKKEEKVEKLSQNAQCVINDLINKSFTDINMVMEKLNKHFGLYNTYI